MKKPVDRSYLAARRQLEAMAAGTFEIGIRDQKGQMLIRTWSKDKVLENLAWLKRENAKGADVYVRPAGERSAGLVLVDDVTRGTLAQMKAEGFSPAAVVETSPDNFQAWVRISPAPLPPDVATVAASALAKHYGGDPNSADWRHFGRLAGLTNTKPHHKDDRGRSPYVLAHESSGQHAERGYDLVKQSELQIEKAAQRALDRQAEADREQRQKAVADAPDAPKGRDPTQTYRQQLKTLQKRYGEAMDVSKADFMIAVDMAKRGFTAEQIGAAIEQASPELPTRKAGHEADYVARTVKAAIERYRQDRQDDRLNRQPDYGPSW